MNYGTVTNIYLWLIEGCLEMVSYIYTKTSSILFIKTPQKILLNIKEMDSLSSNIDSQTVYSENPQWVLNNTTALVFYQP